MAVALGLVVLPLWAAWWRSGRTVVVHPDRVVVRRTERAVRTSMFTDLTEARPGIDGSAGAATPEFWTRSVTLRAGRPRVAGAGSRCRPQTVGTIDPPLLALAPVVAGRPALLPHDVHRTLFAEYVLRAGQGRQRG